VSWSIGDAAETRFHRVTLIILRARQLRDGSPARVERRGRKDLAVAAAEVRDGQVAWERLEAGNER
jgi:DNA-directed RNA polymerase subunit K/omega